MIPGAVEVTREVIRDLWPAYCAGTASPQSRALVETYLAQDPELAQRLCNEPIEPRSLAHWPLHRWLLMLALLFSCFAFGRIVSDTSWDTSPAGFIVAASVAALLWVAFLLVIVREQRDLAHR